MNDYPEYAKVSQWCRLSGMGRTRTYEAIARRELTAVKLDSSTLIHVPSGLT